MTDPLSLLKNYFLSGKKIEVIDDYICFDQFCFPKSTKTNYFRTASHNIPREGYTIEALLFFLKNIETKYTSYITQANKSNIQIITFPDVKGVSDFFTGVVKTTPNIDKSMPPPIPQLVSDIFSNRNKKDIFSESQLSQGLSSDDRYTKKDTSISTGDIRAEGDLTKVMSVDDIAYLKIKRLAHKKTAVQDIDGMGLDEDIYYEREDIKPAKVKKYSGPYSEFNEKVTRNRNTILQAFNKDFSNVVTIIDSIRSKESIRRGEGEVDPTQDNTLKMAERRQTYNDAQEKVTYNRYDQERFNREKDTAGFKINTLGSFKGFMSSIETQAIPEESQTAQEQIKRQPNKRESKTPIIIVPSAPSSMITLANVSAFLQDFKYITPQEAKKIQAKKDSHILINRKKEKILNGEKKTITVPYIIIDNTDRLIPSDWNRVVAVFVHGPLWQFKGWPFLGQDSCPSEIFSKIIGFHLKYTDSEADNNVKKWNVKILNVLRNRRHIDRACVASFWDSLDSFIERTKPFLRY